MDFETAATLKPRPLVDPFARAITYLRVSVTDRCDFRCVYCMAENMVFLPKQDLLSLEELDRLCSAFVAKGVRKLRLTGGEPLVRRGIMTLVASLARHLAAGDLDELTLTTNGSQLGKYAGELAAHGVKRINVSLDTLDPDKFREITRWGDVDKVLAGIDAARAENNGKCPWGGRKIGTRISLTEEKEAAAKKMHQEGQSIPVIARLLGLSKQTVYRGLGLWERRKTEAAPSGQ